MKDAKEIMEALLAGKKLVEAHYSKDQFVHLVNGRIIRENGDPSPINMCYPQCYSIYEEPESKVKQKWFRRKWILDLSSMTAFHPRYYSSKKAFDEDWNPNNYLKVSPEWEEIEI